MSLPRIFFAWLLSVIIGSLLLAPLGGGVALISLVFSAVCSLPTLIALLVVAYSNTHTEYMTKVKWINITHIIMFILTLLVGYYQTESVQYIMIVSFYALVASIIWFLMFSNEFKEKKRTLTEQEKG